MNVAYAIASDVGAGGIGDIAYREASALEGEGHLQRLFATQNSSDVDSFEKPFYGYALEKAGVPFEPFGRADLGYIVKNKLFDRYVARRIDRPDVFIGWAGQCLESLRVANDIGATTFVVRASSHALVQKRLVEGEYRKYGIDKPLSHPWHAYMNIAEYEEADYIIIPSDFVEQSFLDMGFDRDRLVKIPFGVDADRFRPGDAPETFRAVFVGQVTLRKGVQYLLSAWTDLDLEDAELRLVGPVRSDASFLRDRYESDDSIQFLGRRSDVPDILRSASVFVFPSIEEGSALVTYEAMAAGLPQITTFNAGSWITDGAEGFVVPTRDEAAIGDRLQYLYENRSEITAMGERARETAHKYPWQRHEDALIDACLDLTAEGSSSS